jgi:hypothetical protein
MTQTSTTTSGWCWSTSRRATSVSRLDAGVGERRAEESPDLIVVVDHEDA